MPPRLAFFGLRRKPLLQSSIDPGLPTGAAGPECANKVRVKSNRDLHLCRLLVRTASTTKHSDGGSDATTRGDNTLAPVEPRGIAMGIFRSSRLGRSDGGCTKRLGRSHREVLVSKRMYFCER